MKNLIHLKLTLYAFLLLLFTTCSDDDKVQYQLTTEVDTRVRLAENTKLDLSDKFNIELLAKSLKSVYLKEG